MVTKKQNDLVDLGSEDSFPASDPPSYMGGIGVAGRPPHPSVKRKPVSTELLDPDQAEPDVPPADISPPKDRS